MKNNWLDKYLPPAQENNVKNGGIIPKAKDGEAIKQREDFKGNWLSKQASGGFRRDSYGKIGDLYRYFGGIPLKNNVLYNSKYKPTNSKNPNAKYISVKDKPFIDNIIDDANRIFVDKKLQISNDDKRSDAIINDSTVSVNGYSYGKPTSAIGKYFISKGKDSKGEYISYYDVFDRDKGKKGNGFDFNSTKPFELYDRIYVNKDKDGKYIPTHTTTQIENSPIDKTKLKPWEGGYTFEDGGKLTNFTTKKQSNWLDKY